MQGLFSSWEANEKMFSSEEDADATKVSERDKDWEYNWVILMHGPQGLHNLKGLFCWVKPAMGRLQNHEISHCFPLHWCSQFLVFQGGYLEENTVLFSLHICCPALEMEWWEYAGLLQVSCPLHTTMSVLMCLQLWTFFFLYLFLLLLIGKYFHY